ncbi:MAG: hypothetical protein HFH49_02680 [Lachnospiraceae bacterium]|nr:hypothetical protein [Lachnospiraceae bacterium]
MAGMIFQPRSKKKAVGKWQFSGSPLFIPATQAKFTMKAKAFTAWMSSGPPNGWLCMIGVYYES